MNFSAALKDNNALVPLLVANIFLMGYVATPINTKVVNE